VTAAVSCIYRARLGGLPWLDVRPLIMAAAERMRCERVVVFAPQ
jgi:hypothetical protein